MRVRAFAPGFLALASYAAMAACSYPASPSPPTADFVVEVDSERFVVRTSHAETIQLAEDNRHGRNQRFPIGTLRAGNGGFNAPWTWHMDPASVRFVEVAIEVCDGRPSYVETHQSEFTSYCPSGARVVARQ